MLMHFKSLRRCEGSEWIKIGVDTGAGKTAWPQSITYGPTILGDSDLTFHTATGELVKGGKRMRVVGCDDWRVNLRVRGVQAPVCKPLLSVGEYTTVGGVIVLCGDKGYMFHKGSNVAKKIDAWIQKEMRDSQYYGCAVAYKENNVYNIYMKPSGNKTDAMPLSDDSDNRSSESCRQGPNPVRPENPDPEDPGGAHDPMRDDAMDGEELMVPRVPIVPPEPSARQIAEHELTGHGVYRRWCRPCVASKGRAHAHPSQEEGVLPEIGIDYGFFGRGGEDVLPILCVKCRNSSTECLGATVVDRKGASDYASSFLTASIKSLGVQENPGEI